MVSEQEGYTTVDGLTVYDCIVITQIIDKLLKGGLVTGREVGHVALLRAKVIAAAEKVIGFNIDNGRVDQDMEV